MNNLTPRPERSAFGQYAATSARRVIGELLKFNKGDYLAGPDAEALPAGAQAVAVMSSTLIGWQHWQDGQPVDSNVGLLADGFQMPSRSALGFEDSSRWERDPNGDLRDPWQPVNQLVLIASLSSRILTFVTSSRGGIEAVMSLCDAYDQELRRRRVNAYPRIKLDCGSYQHRDRSIGYVKFPVFKVLEFVNGTEADARLALVRGRQEKPSISRLGPPDEAEAPPPPSDADYGGAIDDDVPF